MKRYVTLKSGHTLAYDDVMRWHRITVANGRFSEPKPLFYAVLLCRSGDLVVDAGANIGQYSVWLASRGVEIVAFEPNPGTFELLVENLAPYRSREINCALGDVDGEARLTGKPGDELSHVAKRDGGSPISIRRLDSVHVGSRVHLLKADVEGYEGHVLRGAWETIQRDRPYIQLEVEERWMKRYGWTTDMLRRELVDLGYNRFVDYFGRTFNWKKPIANTVFAGIDAEHWLPRLVPARDAAPGTVEP